MKSKAMFILLIFILALGYTSAQDRIKIEKKDDLPRHTYNIDKKAVELLKDDTSMQKLIDEVQKDLQSDLDKFDIADKTTLMDYYGELGTIAVIEGRYEDYLGYYEKQIELEDKEAARYTKGLTTRAIVRAKMSNSKDPFMVAYIYAKELIDAMPYEVVEANLKSSKASTEIYSENLVLGQVESALQPIIDKTEGEISKEIASQLISMKFALDFYIPFKDYIGKALQEAIDANFVEKEDIWAERDFELIEGDGIEPAIIAVWDSGLDTKIFEPKNQLWVNEKEELNGKDDDGNGFVDDIHGIAYDLKGNKVTDILYPIGDIADDEKELQRLMKGLSDLQSAVDSKESAELKEMLSKMERDEVKPFIENLGLYGNYAHGTHVAGIALKGNPYARLLFARLTFDYRMIPEKPTKEQAEKDSKALVETVEYFKANGVKAVNMSWGGNLASIESALEANDSGETPEERKQLAREIYDIVDKPFREAIKNAPEILFITSSGNSNNDVTFDEFYPSSYDYPNILSVGAVDQAGDETSFTSFGKVDVYGNGFEVLSYVPGGDMMKMNGTSMSSPQVLNLAGKLLAVNPELTTTQLKELIIKGCDERQAGERVVRLINPKKSLQLLKEMM